MTTQYIIALSDFYFYAARDLPELCFCFPLFDLSHSNPLPFCIWMRH